jgi:alanine racemase
MVEKPGTIPMRKQVIMDSRPTRVEIHMAALRHNLSLVRAAIPESCGIFAVVKADAYGHEIEFVVPELDALGVEAFGVSFLHEAIQIRKLGIDRPILILGGVYPGQERKCVGYNLSTAIFSMEQARVLNDVAGRLYRRARIHLKVDSGMGRLGLTAPEASQFLKELHRFRNLELEGIFSHFASADELDAAGQRYTDHQAELFAGVVAAASREGFAPRHIHVANSAALFSRELPFCTMARPGIVLYGALPSTDFQGKLEVQPVMRLRSRVAMLKWVEPGTSISYARRFAAERRSLIASVPVGYADGYIRALTNKGEALVHGERARVAGTVCMDWIMLDVTHIPGVKVGDEVTLLGCDGAGNCITAEELAVKGGTIPYEIFCGISKRVPRVLVP